MKVLCFKTATWRTLIFKGRSADFKIKLKNNKIENSKPDLFNWQPFLSSNTQRLEELVVQNLLIANYPDKTPRTLHMSDTDLGKQRNDCKHS